VSNLRQSLLPVLVFPTPSSFFLSSQAFGRISSASEGEEILEISEANNLKTCPQARNLRATEKKNYVWGERFSKFSEYFAFFYPHPQYFTTKSSFSECTVSSTRTSTHSSLGARLQLN
jgi:hypothetical protein